MRTYNNSIVIKFDTTATGNAGAGKPVTVYEAGTVTKAELFNSAEQAITNPVNADNEGNYSFKVANGIYDIVIDQGLPTQVKIENELITDAAGGGSGSSAIETIQLTSGQVLVQFTVNTEGASFYINGTGADNGRILESVNYSYNQSLNQVTLTNSYPSGTYISAIRDTGYINEDYVRYFDELSDAVTSTKLAIDDQISLKERTAGNGGGGMWSVVLASTVTPNTFNIVACTGVPTLALALAELPKSTPKQWGAIGSDGTDDDFPALEAYMSYFFGLGSSNEIVIGTANLDSGANYGIDGRLHLLNINVNGSGAQFTPLNVSSGLRISGTRMTHKDYRCIFNGQQSDPLAEAIIYGDTARQCSKNTFIEINTRNAYRGAVAKTSNLTLFGNVWINCRCDNSWDWQWHMQMMQGSTSNTWINSHARGFLAGGGSPKGFYGENSTEFNFIGNFAVDQVRDGEAMQIVNSQVVNIDILGLESCEIKSASGYLARFGAATVNIGVVSTKVGLFQPGAGNEAYIVQFDGTTANATINHVDNNQEQAGRTGDLYKVRNNNATKLKTLTVNLDDIQTGGNQRLVINLGDKEGYVNSAALLPAAGTARRELMNQAPNPGEFTSFVDDGADFHITSVIHGGTIVTATTANFADIGHPVNTQGKWLGKVVPDTTTGLQMQANGSNANSTWQPSDGGAVTSPS